MAWPASKRRRCHSGRGRLVSARRPFGQAALDFVDDRPRSGLGFSVAQQVGGEIGRGISRHTVFSNPDCCVLDPPCLLAKHSRDRATGLVVDGTIERMDLEPMGARPEFFAHRLSLGRSPAERRIRHFSPIDPFTDHRSAIGLSFGRASPVPRQAPPGDRSYRERVAFRFGKDCPSNGRILLEEPSAVFSQLRCRPATPRNAGRSAPGAK
jgi:hypothetical protein